MNTNSQIRQDAQTLLEQIENVKIEHLEYRQYGTGGFYFLSVNIQGKIFASTKQTNIADAVKEILQQVKTDRNTTDKQYYTLQRPQHIIDCMAWTIEEKMVQAMVEYQNPEQSLSFCANVRDIKYYVDVNMSKGKECITIYDLSWNLYKNISNRLSEIIQKRESEMRHKYYEKIHEAERERREEQSLRDEHYDSMAMGYADAMGW